MGLMNASSQFQRMMDDRLSSVADTTTPFIDDILIGTTATEEEDIFEKNDRDLRKTLDVMENDQFVTNPKRCHFYVREVEFCGFILGQGIRRPAPGKLMAIEKWEPPKTVCKLRAFLGFTNYYSSFIKKC